jgi:hypothetical protein
MLNAIMLYYHAECGYTECRYAGCRYAGCRYGVLLYRE